MGLMAQAKAWAFMHLTEVLPWPETLEALRYALESRPKPADDDAERLIFLTTSDRPWVRENIHRSSNNSIEKVVLVDIICHEFDKFITQLGFKRKSAMPGSKGQNLA